MREVIGMSKWHEEVLTNGLSLDLKDIPTYSKLCTYLIFSFSDQ
jgi:hypothetical protein